MAKHPEVVVDLLSIRKDAGSIVGASTKEMQNAGIPVEERDSFRMEAYSGDFNHLLATVMEWVEIEYPEEDD